LLIWLEQDDRGEPVEFPDEGYKWNELGAVGQKFYAEHASDCFAQNRQKLIAAKVRLLSELSKRSNQELYGSPWYGKWTKGRMIQLNSSSPYENARGRLRRWLRQQTG